MNFDSRHIDSTLQNIDQATAYVMFLELQQWRHMEDMAEITKQIDQIEKNWGLKTRRVR